MAGENENDTVKLGGVVQRPAQFDEVSRLPDKEQQLEELLTAEQAKNEMQQVEFEGEVHEFPKDFSEEEISNALTGQVSEEPQHKVYYGKGAIKQVEKDEGKLTDIQQHLVTLEGYVRGEYKDTKGIVTRGVGQTGKFADMTFKQSFEAHVKRTKSRIRNFDALPDFVKQELIQAEYRGDLALSPKFRGLFNAGNYQEAAAEFLDSDDYRNSLEEGTGVADRMEMVSEAIMKFAAAQAELQEQTSES